MTTLIQHPNFDTNPEASDGETLEHSYLRW